MRIRNDLTLRTDLETTEDNEIYAIIDYHEYNKKAACKLWLILVFSIGNTVFICIVLVSMLHFFTEDINELIVIPI